MWVIVQHPQRNFVQVQLAQYNRARRLQLLHHHRIGGWHIIRKEFRAERRPHARCLVQVFERHRNAVQRPAQSSRLQVGLGSGGSLQRLFAHDGDIGVQARVQRRDSLQIKAGDGDGRPVTLLDMLCNLGKGCKSVHVLTCS